MIPYRAKEFPLNTIKDLCQGIVVWVATSLNRISWAQRNVLLK